MPNASSPPLISSGIAVAMINGFVSRANACERAETAREIEKSRAESAEKIARTQAESAMALEEQRQKFTAEQNEKNAELQREPRRQDRLWRIDEARQNFEYSRDLEAWKLFLAAWPLEIPAEVVRNELLTPGGTAALRVVFSPSGSFFTESVRLNVEDELRDFAIIYNGDFQSDAIQYRYNAFTERAVVDDSATLNIWHALKELPTIIIEAAAKPDEDEIVVSFTLRGLGDARRRRVPFVKLPYEKTDDKTRNKALAKKLASYLKFIMGYSYDACNFIENDRAPLLPSVAAYEASEVPGPSAILSEPALVAEINRKYRDLYFSALAPPSNALAPLTEERSTILHELRLGYVEASSTPRLTRKFSTTPRPLGRACEARSRRRDFCKIWPTIWRETLRRLGRISARRTRSFSGV